MYGPNIFLTRRQVIALAAAGAALAGCASAPPVVTTTNGVSTTPAEQAVRAMLERYWAVSLADDAEAILAYLADDAKVDSILAGGKAFGLAHGRHVDFNLPKLGKYDMAPGKHYGVCSRPVDANARMTNLLLTMLNKMEVNVEKFADSLGPVSEVVA